MAAQMAAERMATEQMETRSIEMDVSLLAEPPEGCPGSGQPQLMRSDVLRSHIETQLAACGRPLRWAITSVDNAQQIARVEAVVTVSL